MEVEVQAYTGVEGACLLGGVAFLPVHEEAFPHEVLDFPTEVDQNLVEASGVEVLDSGAHQSDQEAPGAEEAEMAVPVEEGEEALVVGHCQMEVGASRFHWPEDPSCRWLEVERVGQHLQQEALLMKEGH